MYCSRSMSQMPDGSWSVLMGWVGMKALLLQVKGYTDYPFHKDIPAGTKTRDHRGVEVYESPK